MGLGYVDQSDPPATEGAAGGEAHCSSEESCDTTGATCASSAQGFGLPWFLLWFTCGPKDLFM